MPRRHSARARALGLALLGLVLAGCRDAAAPDAALDVRVDAALEGAPAVVFAPDGTPFLQCGVRMTAQAAGVHRGQWSGGTVRWYAGLDRSTPFDTLALNADDLRNAWETASGALSPEIAGGTTIHALLNLAAIVPFEAEIALRYRELDASAERTVSMRVACGPLVPADAAPPAITFLVASSSPTPLATGDTLAVTFTARSAASVWRSFVELTGPCQMVAQVVEPLLTSVTRRVAFSIPAGCSAGVPFTVRVGMEDGAGRGITRELVTTQQALGAGPSMAVEAVPGSPLAASTVGARAWFDTSRGSTRVSLDPRGG